MCDYRFPLSTNYLNLAHLALSRHLCLTLPAVWEIKNVKWLLFSLFSHHSFLKRCEYCTNCCVSTLTSQLTLSVCNVPKFLNLIDLYLSVFFLYTPTNYTPLRCDFLQFLFNLFPTQWPSLMLSHFFPPASICLTPWSPPQLATSLVTTWKTCCPK